MLDDQSATVLVQPETAEDDEGDCPASCTICGKACTKASNHSGQHWCSTHQGY